MQLRFLKVETWLNDAFKLLALTVSDERVGEVEVAHHADLGVLGPGLDLPLDGDEVMIRVMLVVHSLLRGGKKDKTNETHYNPSANQTESNQLKTHNRDK